MCFKESCREPQRAVHMVTKYRVDDPVENWRSWVTQGEGLPDAGPPGPQLTLHGAQFFNSTPSHVRLWDTVAGRGQRAACFKD